MTPSRFLRGGLTLLLAITLSLFAVGTLASGSYTPKGKVSNYGTDYKQGKIIFHKKILCDDCTLQKINAESARELIEAIRTRGGLKENETEMDKIATDLTAEEAGKVEQYLARRFNIKKK